MTGNFGLIYVGYIRENVMTKDFVLSRIDSLSEAARIKMLDVIIGPHPVSQSSELSAQGIGNPSAHQLCALENPETVRPDKV